MQSFSSTLRSIMLGRYRAILCDQLKQILSRVSHLSYFKHIRFHAEKRSRRFQAPRNHTHRFRINDAAKKAIACPLFPAAAEEGEEEKKDSFEFHAKTSSTCVRFGNADGPFTVNP